jgi:hypothetical protein
VDQFNARRPDLHQLTKHDHGQVKSPVPLNTFAFFEEFSTLFDIPRLFPDKTTSGI